MFGDTDPASAGHTEGVKDGDKIRPFTSAEKEVAFYAKPVWKRALVVFAGPGINFLFAIILLFGLYAWQGQPITPPIASGIMVGQAADKAGFEPHDVILSINGEKIKRFEDVRRIVTVALDTPLKFEVERGGELMEINAVPKKETLEDRFGFKHSRGLIGIIGPGSGLHIDSIIAVNDAEVSDDTRRAALLGAMGNTATITLDRGETTDQIRINPFAANNEGLKTEGDPAFNSLIISESLDEVFVKEGVVGSLVSATQETWGVGASTLKALGQMFTGTRSATELGGIIRIGAIAGDMAQAGLIALITFTALLSINLGLINLFPIPMLDGGHLVFYAVEAIKGKPVPEKVQEYAFRVGFVMLMCLMVFANLNDLIQLVL